MLLLSTLVGRENPSPLSPPKLPGVRLASAGGSLLFVFDCRWGSGAQLSAQPMGQGNEQERAACRQDVRRFRQGELQRNLDDTLSITGCLQAYRTKISRAWLNASNSQHKCTDRCLDRSGSYRSIRSTVRYTELAPGRFKNIWR
jgi:hypothetical protein